MSGVNVEHGYQQASNGKQLLNKDDLYFNDMDIRAWERRTAALGALPTRNDRGYPEDEGYDDDARGPMSAAEFEEVLFQRVLDKIRLARAADLPDVQLTPEELDAYQSKLHGTRSPAARPSRSSRSSPHNDAMSVANASTTSKKGSSSSRSKKEQQRASLFSKPKKDKPSGRKRTPSNIPSAPAPGFVIPGPDGQPIYTPIAAYQGSSSLARDPLPPPLPTTQPASTSAPPPAPLRRSLSDMPGAFPGALPTSPHLYHHPSPYSEPHSPLNPSPDALGITTRTPKPSSKPPSSSNPKLKPSPIEPYHYHSFSSSSSTQSSPKPKYSRRVSSAESSYTAMPRRIPVPAPAIPQQQRPQPNYLDMSLSPRAAGLRVERTEGDGGVESISTGAGAGAGVEGVGMRVDVDQDGDGDGDVQTESARASSSRKQGSGSGKEERRRKSGKAKRK